ncbi:MAG: hypothetical protein IKZ33_10135, partial [Lentisphaeria bacterium]|nr:hypothetical protein [Lentisphaeria bacterium]
AETVVSGSESEFITALAATDGRKGALLLANFEREGVLASLEVQEQPTACFLINEKNVFKQLELMIRKISFCPDIRCHLSASVERKMIFPATKNNRKKSSLPDLVKEKNEWIFQQSTFQLK